MKTKNLQLLLLLAVFKFLNCTKNDDPILPPITQTGANTFGCIINGEVLIPKDGRGVPQPKGLDAGRNPNGNFYVSSSNLQDDNGLFIYIYINNLTSIGTYNVGLSNGQSTSTFEPDFPHIFCTANNNGQRNVYYSNANSGTITVTRFDTVNSIISGTFQLTVFNKDNPNETIEITDGRFDVNWIEL